jgi:hypothetical protein
VCAFGSYSRPGGRLCAHKQTPSQGAKGTPKNRVTIMSINARNIGTHVRACLIGWVWSDNLCMRRDIAMRLVEGKVSSALAADVSMSTSRV